MKTFEVFYDSGYSDLFSADSIDQDHGVLLLFRHTYDINRGTVNGFYVYMMFAPGAWSMIQEVEEEDETDTQIQVDLEENTLGKALSA